MNRPCKNAITCPGPVQTLDGDDPIVNFSSEAIDGVNFEAMSWPFTAFLNPFQPDDPSNPPSTCASPLTQEDADLCAIRKSIDDHNTVPQVPHGGQQLFGNTPQSCVLQCPDGTPFIWEVPAGTFLAYDVLTANEKAAAYACQQAGKNIFCIFTSALTGCLNQPYLVQVRAIGGVPPYNISIIGGTPPPLVGFFQADSSTAFFSGQPSAPGTYPVAVRAIDSRGISVTRTINLTVMEVSNANSIPSPQINIPYVFQLQGFGGVEPYFWQLQPGSSLPSGLALNVQGVISGIPTTSGPFTPFSVRMTDATGAVCVQQLTFPSISCPFFNTIVWQSPPDTFLLPGPPNAGAVVVSYPTPNAIELQGFSTMAIPGQMSLYENNGFCNRSTSEQINCSLRINVKSVSGFANYFVGVADPTFTTYYIFVPLTVAAVGVTTYPFTIPSGATSFGINFLTQFGDVLAVSGSMDIEFDFGV